MTAVLLVLVFVPMILEARRSARNERGQRARGGVEPPGDVYGLMAIAYPAAFLAMIIEGAVRGGPPPRVLAEGVAVFAVAKALKWWAIRSLGSCWTFRVIVVPGGARVASGPYRYLRHPNYVAIAGELVGVALMAGALIAGPVGTTVFMVLMRKRMAVENGALDAILPRT